MLLLLLPLLAPMLLPIGTIHIPMQLPLMLLPLMQLQTPDAVAHSNNTYPHACFHLKVNWNAVRVTTPSTACTSVGFSNLDACHWLPDKPLTLTRYIAMLTALIEPPRFDASTIRIAIGRSWPSGRWRVITGLVAAGKSCMCCRLLFESRVTAWPMESYHWISLVRHWSGALFRLQIIIYDRTIVRVSTVSSRRRHINLYKSCSSSCRVLFRFVFVTYPRYGVDWCSLYRAKLTVCLVVIVTVIVCIPNFITVTVKSYDDQKIDPPPRGQREITNRTADRWNASWDLGSTGSGNGIDGEDMVWLVTFKSQSSAEIAMKSFNFWIQAILVKLVPCIGLTILSLLLVKTMRESNKQRLLLKQKRTNTTDPVFSLDAAAAGNEVRLLPEKPEAADHRDRATDRTTRLLLCVVILFLLTEFPQGILTLLGGILSEAFVDEIYIPLGDLFDIAVLINSGVNFVLYCTMSEQFRDTFAQVFLSRCRCRNDGHDKINNGSDSSHLSTSKKTRATSHWPRERYVP